MIKLSTLLQRSADPSTRYSIRSTVSECMHAHALYMGTCVCQPAWLHACLSFPPVCAAAHHRLLLFSLRDPFFPPHLFHLSFLSLLYFLSPSFSLHPSSLFTSRPLPSLLTSSPFHPSPLSLSQGPLHHSSDETSSTERLLPPSRVPAGVSVRTLSLSGPAPTVTHIPPLHSSLFPLYSLSPPSSPFLLFCIPSITQPTSHNPHLLLFLFCTVCLGVRSSWVSWQWGRAASWLTRCP